GSPLQAPSPPHKLWRETSSESGPCHPLWLTTKPLFLETICWLQGFCSNPME
ncbi:Endonuclease NucS, partial [Dissostichus eleginoides]